MAKSALSLTIRLPLSSGGPEARSRLGVPFDFAQGRLSPVEAWDPTGGGGGGAPPTTK
jgi:hypothetical protein